MTVLLSWQLLGHPATAVAAPGVCIGPVCGDGITRSAQFPWQLRLRIEDQSGHRERIVVDCRGGAISPAMGPVGRTHAAALVRRACRVAVAASSGWAGPVGPTSS